MGIGNRWISFSRVAARPPLWLRSGSTSTTLRQTYDIVLTDIKMPGTGVELLSRIQNQLHSQSSVSAFVDIDTAMGTIYGSGRLCIKPFKADEVILKIRLAYSATYSSEQEELKAENKRLRIGP